MLSQTESILRLPVMEHFYTIQGEGYNTGTATYFIRLGGCDVGCVWCDVKESWDAAKHPMFTIDQIASEILSFPARKAVITGGEPFMYDLTALCELLHKKGVETLVETSGAYPVRGEWDWICVSPKKFKPPVKEVLEMASELKVVIFHKSDFEWAESNAQFTSENCKLYLQPEWSKREQMMPLIVDYVKANPKWKVCLQTHKYLNIP